MPASLLTIGHSNHAASHFLALLAQHAVTALCDVRSVPRSRRWPQFSDTALARALAEAGIRYLWLGDALGGRPKGLAHLPDAAARYRAIAARGDFRAACDRVIAGAARHRIALMCAERDPLRCHRTLLVCRHLRTRARIDHILGDGTLEPQAALEARMMRMAGTEPPPLLADAASMASGLAAAYDAVAQR